MLTTTRARHLFSVDDYERMVETRILGENHRVELILGEILEKLSVGDPHWACSKRMVSTIGHRANGAAIVSIRNPIRLPDSVPEPDFALLRSRADFYGTGKPRPADIFLLIEILALSNAFDRKVKGPLYAEAGIREYWIVNLEEECVEIHRDPQPDGSQGDMCARCTSRRADRARRTAGNRRGDV